MRFRSLAVMALLLVGLLATDSPAAQFQPATPPDWEAFESREDLATAGDLEGAQRVLRFVQMSDVHIIDDDAPAPMRVNALDDVFYGSGVSKSAARPQEEYTDELLNSMIRTINDVHMEDALDFIINTGDNIDNELENELMRFIDNWEGTHTTVGPYSGESCAPDGPSADYEDDSQNVEDQCTSLPVEVAQNNTPLIAGLPWFSAFGNHDGLIQGNVPVQPSFDDAAAEFGRYFLRQHEYVGMHFASGGSCVQEIPQGSILDDWGHGYGFAGERLCDESPDNDGYYAFDHRGVRFIVLDTVNDDFVTANENLAGQFVPQEQAGYDIIGGYAEGAIDPVQFDWLTTQLENHQDQVIMIFSHHTVNSMFSSRTEGQCSSGQCLHDLLEAAGYKTGPEIQEELTQYDNVVAWVGGHTHRHRVEPKLVEGNPAGFWNVESSSLIDLPQQGRIIEVWVDGNGTKGFLKTERIDHGFELARDLAATDTQAPGDAAGEAQDQDVLLWFDIPPAVDLQAQPALSRFLVLTHVGPTPMNGSHGHVGEPLDLQLKVRDNLFQTGVAGLDVHLQVRHANATGGTTTAVDADMVDAGNGSYTYTFTPDTAATHFVDYMVMDPSGTYETAGRLASLDIAGDEPVEKKGKKSPLPVVFVIAGIALALIRRK